MKKTLNRRQFLKTTLVSVGSISTVSMLGCGGSSSSSSTGSTGAASNPAIRFFPQSIASGDPRQESIILWTRLQNHELYSVDLQVSLQSDFSEPLIATDVTASIQPNNDSCLKIKVTGLEPGNTYYYRFVVRDNDDVVQNSRLGRFKTAGDATDEAPVRFAFLSCQDYIGRYYNSLFSLLNEQNDDLNFVLHLGDYIYETTGDPSFQNTSGRTVSFTHPDEALTVTKNGNTFLAAKSLSNYRDLYKTYRSDEVLQQVHEKFAFVNIWDDHEFSDDSWQDNGTYQGVETGEQDAERKQASAQAFFEFQPIDLDGSGSPLTGTDLGDGVADNSAVSNAIATSAVSRTLRFGKHVNLSLADYRTHRPDHLIPEDAFPGEIRMDQAACVQTLVGIGKAPTPELATAFTQSAFFKYIDTSSPTYPVVASPATGNLSQLPISMLIGNLANPSESGPLTLALAGAYQQAYMATGIDEGAAQLQGFQKAATLLSSQPKLDIVSVNALLDAAAQVNPAAAALKVDPSAELEHGLSYAQMGKQSVAGSSLGSRYLVIRDSYELYCAYLSLVVGDQQYDDAWGVAQTGSLLGGMAMSPDATWQVLGSSVSFTSLLLNGDLLANAIDSLSPGASAAIPAELKENTFYLNVDQWDGFPIRRKVLMGDIASPLPTNLKAQNTVILSGDIHASFATDHGIDISGNRAVEFTVAGVSSANFGDLLGGQAGALLAGNPVAGQLLTALPLLLDPLLQGANQTELGAAMAADPSGATAASMQNMKMSRSTVNGTAVLTATAESLTVSYYHYSELAEASNIYGLGGIPPMEVRTFNVAKNAGKNSPLTEV